MAGGSPWSWFGSVSGSGHVSIGGAHDDEVLGLEPPVVSSADRDQIVDVGPAAVSVPLLDVVEFAPVHGRAAFEASAVAYGDGQALGGVTEALVSS